MSGVLYTTINKRVERLKGADSKSHPFNIRTAEIQSSGGTQLSTLIPIKTVISWLLNDYSKQRTQKIYDSLIAIHKQQKLDAQDLINLHTFNVGNKSRLKQYDREKQIQIAYQIQYGGEIEYPTANGRIDLLTDTTIYEFKNFRGYKSCLGQLLAYSDCVSQIQLVAVLFEVPKSLEFTGSECQRVKQLLNKYKINVEFLR